MPRLTPKPENLAALVLAVRGEKVLLDADIARLYGVETKVLNQAVKRNLNRFPADFMFQLTAEEWEWMRSQTVTSSSRASPMRSQVVTEMRYDAQFSVIFDAIKQLIADDQACKAKPKRSIGFV